MLRFDLRARGCSVGVPSVVCLQALHQDATCQEPEERTHALSPVYAKPPVTLRLLQTIYNASVKTEVSVKPHSNTSGLIESQRKCTEKLFFTHCFSSPHDT